MLAFVCLIYLSTPLAQDGREKKICDHHERELPNECPTKGSPSAISNAIYLWLFLAVGRPANGARYQKGLAFCGKVPTQRWQHRADTKSKSWHFLFGGVVTLQLEVAERCAKLVRKIERPPEKKN